MRHTDADIALAARDAVWTDSTLATAARALRLARPGDAAWNARARLVEDWARELREMRAGKPDANPEGGGA